MSDPILWHTCTVDRVYAELETGPGGLSPDRARARLTERGPNELPRAAGVTAGAILIGQFKNLLILILLVAAGVSAYLGDVLEAAVIGIIVLFAILLGFVQEYRAGRALEALREMAAPSARVVRDGQPITIPARDLVPGDLVLLAAGDRIPADLRLVETASLRVNEAALTGESIPVEKDSEPLDDPGLGIGDRSNLAYSGTDAVFGRGQGLVVATGLHTELGRITGMLAEVEEPRTPLQQGLDRVGRVLAIAAGLLVLAIAGLGVLRGEPLVEMFVFGVALAVAVVPEALPAVVTISLAIGVQRMVKRHALVRRLPTVETLGSTSVICSDKTGTLTCHEMTVRDIWIDGNCIAVDGTGYAPQGAIELGEDGTNWRAMLRHLLTGAALCNDSRLVEEDGIWRIQGDPTEGALVVAAAKWGLVKDLLEGRAPRLDEIPFSSERKRMTTLHRTTGGVMAFTKGAVETVLADCTDEATELGVRRLGPEGRARIERAARRMARKAMRVLAIAYKPNASRQDAERDTIFAGLVGMIDPPRPEAREAIERCEQAGVRPIMITGDHPVTAEAIARELGILKSGRMVTGRDLDAMSPETLQDSVEGIEVYARVSPEHKLRVVEAWQARGQICAMTGDGVNDAPALKRADIGVAMGIAGTDVSREAADMTLTDDNFASIVAAVEEGRGIFSNIKKYLMYLLSSNIGEVGLVAAATLAGMPLPLSAVQILYVNLATDGLPALALAFDPPEPGLMRRPPRDPKSGIFTPPVVNLMMTAGIWIGAVTFALFLWDLRRGEALGLDAGPARAHAMTMAFVALVSIQFFNAYNFRSDRRSILCRPFANRWLNLAIAWELTLLLAVVHVPILSRAFGTIPLTPMDWLVAVGAAATVMPVVELAKWLHRRLIPSDETLADRPMGHENQPEPTLAGSTNDPDDDPECQGPDDDRT